MSTPDPSDEKKSVYFVHVKRDIDAPVEKVWDTLMDLPKYKEWNTFMPEITVTDSAQRSLGTKGQKLEEGSYLRVALHTDSSVSNEFERIKSIDHENHRLLWKNRDYPSWLRRAKRWQTVASIEGKTRYETWEQYNGVFAYFTKWFSGKAVKGGLEAMADGLKARCEA